MREAEREKVIYMVSEDVITLEGIPSRDLSQ